MAHVRRALHLGKSAYFTFDIEILDVVNIPFPQGRFLVKWNFKSGLLNPKDVEQIISSSTNPKAPPSAVSADPAYGHHLLSSSTSFSAHSSASSVISIDPPIDPSSDDVVDDSSEFAADGNSQKSSKPPSVLNSNDKVGFSHPVRLNRSHAAEFHQTLKCSVSIPVRENQLGSCDLKLSVRHQYQCNNTGRWETSKLGETIINLSQYAHKEWVPQVEKPTWRRDRDDTSVKDQNAYGKVQRFLLQHGKTNALLRLQIACTMIGGEKYKESRLKAQEKPRATRSDSSESLSPSARSRTDSRRQDSEGSWDGGLPARESRSTDGRTAQEVIDDIWAQARKDVAGRKNASMRDSSSTISSRPPSSDGVIVPEPRRKSDEQHPHKREIPIPVKKLSNPVSHFNLSVPATFRKRTESTTSRSGSAHSSFRQSPKKGHTQ